ncbi:hypothetical protein DL96DRAFT_1713893 [Flagelloscypha sp. PMI_526]|nr:hypothetical protein DL96DRAFT_1713893 [Flagelloscypha sp. PMI_526]
MLHLQSFSTVVPPLATPLRDEYLDVETFSSSNASIFVYALAWLQTLLGFLSSLISLIFFHFSHPPSPESESTISPPPQRREPSDDVSPFVQSWVQDRQLALIASQCELMLEEQEIAVASQGTTRPIPIRGATVAYMAPTPLPTRDRTHSVPDLLAVPFSTLPSHSPPTLTRQNSAPCALSTLVPVPGARRFSLSSVESEGIVTPLDEDVDDVKSTLEYVDELIREAEAKEEDRLRNLSEKTGFRRRLAWHVKSALHL